MLREYVQSGRVRLYEIRARCKASKLLSESNTLVIERGDCENQKSAFYAVARSTPPWFALHQGGALTTKYDRTKETPQHYTLQAINQSIKQPMRTGSDWCRPEIRRPGPFGATRQTLAFLHNVVLLCAYLSQYKNFWILRELERARIFCRLCRAAQAMTSVLYSKKHRGAVRAPHVELLACRFVRGASAPPLVSACSLFGYHGRETLGYLHFARKFLLHASNTLPSAGFDLPARSATSYPLRHDRSRVSHFAR